METPRMGAARRGVARGTGKGTLTSAYENKEIWPAARMKPFFFPHAAGNGFRPEAKDRCIAASVPHGHNNGHPGPRQPAIRPGFRSASRSALLPGYLLTPEYRPAANPQAAADPDLPVDSQTDT